MFDEDNGGIAISYEDQHLDAKTRELVKTEIYAIISAEMDKIIEEET
jgi:hypothetical protein